MKKFLLAGVALALIGSATQAADLAVKAPYRAPAVIDDWTGFYIGAHGGYGWGRDPFTATNLDIFGVTVTGPNSKGGVGGFQAGYNQQWGRWVGGLEIDLSGTAIKGTSSASLTGGAACLGVVVVAGLTCTGSASLEDKFDGLGTARARLGFLAWPNMLFYGTGGLAWTRFVQTTTASDVISVPGVLTETFTFSNAVPSWRFGWVVGAGGEVKIYGNWLAGLEYLHYDFGDSGSSSIAATASVVGFGTVATVSASIATGHLTADVVRARLSYKFGGGPVYAAY